MKNPERLEAVLHKNFLRESTLSGDVAKYEPLIIPLIKKLYPQTLVSQIADVQPMGAPTGKIAALFTSYSGSGSLAQKGIGFAADWSALTPNTFTETSRIIAVEGDHSATLPAIIAAATTLTTTTPSAGSCLPLYFEVKEVLDYVNMSSAGVTADPGYGVVTPPATGAYAASGLTVADGPYNVHKIKVTFILVTNFTGAWRDEISTVVELSSAKIRMINANRTAIRKYFYNYTGINLSELNQDVRQVNFSTRAVIVEAKSRKVVTSMPLERMTDLQNIYGEGYDDVVAKIIAHEIRQEIDKEVIDYLRDIATPMNDINLTYSLGNTASTLLDISSDLVANINMAVEDIVRATFRNRTMFVLADSATIGYLKVNPWHVKVEPSENNPYRVGNIGAYPLFCDMYSTDNYILVGYIYDSDESGDAGLIFSPYSHQIVEAEYLGGKNIITINRYAYTRHPQDTGIGMGDSDFFRTFQVKFAGNTPLTPTGAFDIPNLTKNMVKYL